MSKVVLLTINAKYVHSSLAVWYIAGGVALYSRRKHDIKIVESTIKQDNQEIVKQIIKHKPDVVGISTYIWNAVKLPSLLNLICEKLPDAILILGGPEASNNPEYWLTQGVDYILRGEGEYNFPLLIDNLEDNELQIRYQ